jgi:tRNA (cytidine/uridine-2'-O-)-methyltransferase
MRFVKLPTPKRCILVLVTKKGCDLMEIALFEPEIPQNTGNIARLVAAAGVDLNLVGALGFHLSDKLVKRAGMDYINLASIKRTLSLEELYVNKNGRIWLATTKGAQRYSNVKFADEDTILFGPESRGLPKDLLETHPEDCIRIPMLPNLRSLNLANSVAIVLYEALRQLDFPNLIP